jgi:DNA-binding SARP family transcriptional activator
VPIEVDTRKAIALLAYLAVTGESHRRSSLVNLLWPDYDRTRGRAALRRTLYALRKALAGAWLQVDREEIGLDLTADVWVDVTQFRRHLAACEIHAHPPADTCPACIAALTDAVALFRGEFLRGFGLRDSYNFDDWQLFQAEGLRRDLAGALGRLIRWHSSQREFEVAIGYARRQLALDPLDEKAHCELMQLYVWSGQRSAALRQYEECERVLLDQLDLPPQEMTTELYEAIREGHAPPPPAGEHLRPSPERRKEAALSPVDRAPDLFPDLPFFLAEEKPVERPVFVARERELTRLDGFLEAALAGKGQVVFVTGDAGSGKTALMQEFGLRAQAAQADLVVAWGHGNAHTGIGDPYLPFREVLGLLSGDVEAQWAAGAMTWEQACRLWRLLPLTTRALVEAGPDLVDRFVPGGSLVKRARAFTTWPIEPVWRTQLEKLAARAATTANDPNLQQNALFEQFTQVLRTLANQKPLLLALDDLQWVDGGSTNLLFHLGRRIQGSRILLLGAYRPSELALGRTALSLFEEPVPGGVARGAEGSRVRHPLEPVVNEFKRTFGEIEVDLDQAERRQFVDAFLDSEPNRLGDAFRETLYQHSKGYPLFTVELLQGMQDRGDLVQDGEGRWVEGPTLDWETLPARVEAVIAERIGRLPKRLRRILSVASMEGETFTAEALALVEAADEGEIVRCLSELLDREYGLVTARGVLRTGSQRLSRYRFRHILFQKHLYRSLDPVQRVHLHEAVGTALETLYGERTEGAAAIETGAAQLARHFQEAGIIHKAVDYFRQAGERAQRLYANQEAAEHFQQALVLLADVPRDEKWSNWCMEVASQLYEHLGDVREWIGGHDEAKAAYRVALDHVPEADWSSRARLYRKMGNIWRLQRRYEESLRNYDHAETMLGPPSAEPAPEWWQEWIQIQLERMWLYYWLGQWPEISEIADQVHLAVEQQATPAQCISFFLSLASMYSRRDRYIGSEETLAYCQTALAISQESDNLSEIAWARFVLGFNQLWSGQLNEAEKQMRTALALAERTGDIVHQSRCLTYLTILYRKRGQLDKAREHVSRSLAAATAGQMLEYVGMARANLAWLAWREGNLVQAEAEGRSALEMWDQLPAGHSSCVFKWTALWPLASVALAQDRIAEAMSYAQALLEGMQQRLPDPLTSGVEEAIRVWQEDDPETACTCLDRTIELAHELGYL